MKFKIGAPNFNPVCLSWREGIVPNQVRQELLEQLRLLKEIIDNEFDSDPDFSEVIWVNEQIKTLDSCISVDPNSKEGQRLVEAIWAVAGIIWELDRVTSPEAAPIIRNLNWVASNCFNREDET